MMKPLALALLLAAVPAAAKVVPLDWSRAHLHVGRWRTVSGKVAATHKDKRYLYLHFHKDHKQHFTVMIYRRFWKRFPEQAHDYYLGKDVVVRGTIRERSGRPVILVSRRSNLWVVGEKLARPK